MKIGAILRPSSPEYKKIFLQVKKEFEKHNARICLDEESAKMIGIRGVNFEKMCRESDILVSIGGDGTLLSLTRRSYKHDKPIMGIYAGRLGFLTDINFETLPQFLKRFFKGEYRIDERMMIKVKSQSKEYFGFNDVVISRRVDSSMIKIKVDANKQHLNTYYGDGLIISTPTGSTAYNLSAGGPIVYPLTKSFILTPICPHSLTQRPLVLPGNFEITITVEQGTEVVVDGQDFIKLGTEDKLKIKLASKTSKMIHRLERNYFDVLREKLNWGNL